MGPPSAWSYQTFSLVLLRLLAQPTQIGPSGTIAASSGYDTPTFSWSSAHRGRDLLPLRARHDHEQAGCQQPQRQRHVGGRAGADARPQLSLVYRGGDCEGRQRPHRLERGELRAGRPDRADAALAQRNRLGGHGHDDADLSLEQRLGRLSQYYLYLFDATTNQVLINNASVTGTTYTSTPALNVGDSYTWYVAAKSTNNGEIVWSGPDDFTLTA